MLRSTTDILRGLGRSGPMRSAYGNDTPVRRPGRTDLPPDLVNFVYTPSYSVPVPAARASIAPVAVAAVAPGFVAPAPPTEANATAAARLGISVASYNAQALSWNKRLITDRAKLHAYFAQAQQVRARAVSAAEALNRWNNPVAGQNLSAAKFKLQFPKAGDDPLGRNQREAYKAELQINMQIGEIRKKATPWTEAQAIKWAKDHGEQLGSWLSSFVSHNRNTIGAVGGLVSAVVPGAGNIVNAVTGALIPQQQPQIVVQQAPPPPAPVAAKSNTGLYIGLAAAGAGLLLLSSKGRR